MKEDLPCSPFLTSARHTGWDSPKLTSESVASNLLDSVIPKKTVKKSSPAAFQEPLSTKMCDNSAASSTPKVTPQIFSIASPPETLLTVKDEPDSSTTNPVTVSTQSDLTSQPDTVLTVISRFSITVSTSGKRLKGKGTGRIQWRTVTKKNGKQYQQAWYDWQVHEGGKTKTRTKYIPKRLLAKVQALEAAKVPVLEVLRVLGVAEKRSPESKSKILTQFLGGMAPIENQPAKIPSRKTPPRKKREKGNGTGYIYYRTVTKKGKSWVEPHKGTKSFN